MPKIHWRQRLARALLSDTARLILGVAVFVSALIGFLFYYWGYIHLPGAEIPGGERLYLSQTLYSALRVFIGLYDVSFEKVFVCLGEGREWVIVLLEFSRWGGLVFTGSTVFKLVHDSLGLLRVRRRAARPDAIAIHGAPRYKALLAQALGSQAVVSDKPERFLAPRHILAFEDDDQMQKYLSEHYRELTGGATGRKGAIYLCTHNAALANFASSGFVINDMSEDCARLYWKKHFLRRYEGAPETKVALVGFGACGQALLRQAMLINVFPESEAPVEYRVFGDGERFICLHNQLERIVRLNAPAPDRDSLTFCADAPEMCLDALSDMDRILLCDDDERVNLRLMYLLHNQLPRTAIHVRASDEKLVRALHPQFDEAFRAGQLKVFGTDEELYTREAILDERLRQEAMMVHALYMRHWEDSPLSRGKVGLETYVRRDERFKASWNRLTNFQRKSNFYAADHMDVKMRALLRRDCPRTPENVRDYAERLREIERRGETAPLMALEHRRWARVHHYYGWQYAPERSNEERLHPLLLPFDQLPEAAKALDLDVWSMLPQMAAEGQRG